MERGKNFNYLRFYSERIFRESFKMGPIMLKCQAHCCCSSVSKLTEVIVISDRVDNRAELFQTCTFYIFCFFLLATYSKTPSPEFKHRALLTI